MGLITKEVEIGLMGTNIKWFENKGYHIPRENDKRGRISIPLGTKIIVKVKDLPNGSRVKVDCKCNNCDKEYKIIFADYNNYVKKDGEIYCNKCAIKLYGRESARISFLKSRISFEQWCIDNDRQDVLDRWDYELNEYKPNEVGHSTNIKCWIKCPNGLHKSELKRINDFTSKQGGNIKCKQCNSIGQWLIDSYGENALELYWSNKNEYNPFEIDYGSQRKVLLICQNCGETKLVSASNYIKCGLGCYKCSDGVSYCEKIMYSLLKQLNKEFQTQVNKTIYKWCNNYRYDFSTVKNNKEIIMETHGIQHYEKSNRGRSLEEEQGNDRLKEQLAKQNGIEHYIVLDCRKSELEWIKNSVMESELPILLGFNEEDIDWMECHKFACKSFVKMACDLYNNKLTISNISKKLKVCRATIRHYLRQGNQIGLCNYNIKERHI